MKRLVAFAVLVALILNLAGCARHHSIKPEELPKANGSFERSRGTVHTGAGPARLVEVTVVNLERPDGTMVQVEGDFDAIIRFRNGKKVELEHPVVAEIYDDRYGRGLKVKGGNLATHHFAFDKIEEVEVVQYPSGRYAWLSAIGVVALTAGGFYLLAPEVFPD